MVKEIKIEVTCTTCSKTFKLGLTEVRKCPRCGKIHRGPDAPKA
jgi:Zn finger protein HypA/HybF involved in hydrogenase expression